ncbi:hypothetical protein QE152_g25932 [Popillia japonica]|uniref:Uncharacterized protein n=1 Tax=Popillia japonica TaxID=7064 RepID=A0AAW1JYV6_POPJA
MVRLRLLLHGNSYSHGNEGCHNFEEVSASLKRKPLREVIEAALADLLTIRKVGDFGADPVMVSRTDLAQYRINKKSNTTSTRQRNKIDASAL